MEFDFWAVIGKFSAIVGAAIAAITLWGKIFAKKHRVIFDFEEITSPTPDLRVAIEKLLNEKAAEAVERASYGLSVTSVSRSDRDLIVEALKPLVAEKIFSSLRYENALQRQRRLFRVILENKGKKTAKSIVIDFDFSPEFIEFDSEEMARDGKKLKLPELRPGHKVVCDFWLSALTYGQVRVTQEDHILKHRHREVVYGWRAFLAAKILSPAVFPFYLFWLAWSTACLIWLLT